MNSQGNGLLVENVSVLKRKLTLTSKLLKKYKKFSTANEEQQKKISVLKTTLESKQLACQELKEKVVGVSYQLQTADKVLNSNLEQSKKMQKKIGESRNHCLNLTNTVALLKDSAADLEAANSSLNKELQSVKKTIIQKDDQITRLKSELEYLMKS